MCLGSGHRIYDCHIRRKCDVENCGAGHHRLLHGVRHLPTESTEAAVRANCRSTNTAQRGVILRMIPVRVVGPTEDVLTYAFLDSGLDTTLVSQELIARLNLTGKPSKVRVTTITVSQVIPGRTVALDSRSLDGKDEVAVERAHSAPSLRMKPPVDAIRNEICKWSHLEGVPFEEVSYKRPDNDVSADPVEHQMVVHPFGATSSPFCASYALRRTAEDFGSECDGKVAEATANNFYVDDCLISLTDVEKAKRFVPQINKLVARGGFTLRKWISNIPEALCSIPESDRAQTSKGFSDSTLPNEQMLGTEWNPVSDVLRLRFHLRDGPLTRRGILSSISSIFDPLGLVSPLILPAK
ncbi:uncharacterized protein DEA37_0012991, partial [Paragonimus westermani]